MTRSTYEQEDTSVTDLPFIGKPARRALNNAGYTELEQLSGVAEADLLALHGVGQRAIDVLRPALEQAGLPPMRRRGDPA